MNCPLTRTESPPDCQSHECQRCEREDAAERAAIQTEGQDRSVYERAVALILERRKRGQRDLIG